MTLHLGNYVFGVVRNVTDGHFKRKVRYVRHGEKLPLNFAANEVTLNIRQLGINFLYYNINYINWSQTYVFIITHQQIRKNIEIVLTIQSLGLLHYV